MPEEALEQAQEENEALDKKARKKAEIGFGVPSVHVKRVIPTEDVQIYKI